MIFACLLIICLCLYLYADIDLKEAQRDYDECCENIRHNEILRQQEKHHQELMEEIKRKKETKEEPNRLIRKTTTCAHDDQGRYLSQEIEEYGIHGDYGEYQY